MTKQMLKNKVLVIVVLLMFTLSYSNVFAWGRSHEHYSYHDSHWHRSGWFLGDVAIAALAIGTIIAALPPKYETVYVRDVPYYYYDNVYFRPCPSGYIVVPAPTVTREVIVTPVAPIVPSEMQSVDTVIINIPNSKGTYTPVKLIKHGNGYIGPQGEYYEGNPTVAQLNALYGK